MSQISVSGIANNSVVVLCTVTASKTLNILSWTLSVYNTSGGAATGNLFVTNAADTTQYIIQNLRLGNNLSLVSEGTFPKGLNIEAGWKIKIYSATNNMMVYGYIHGFEF